MFAKGSGVRVSLYPLMETSKHDFDSTQTYLTTFLYLLIWVSIKSEIKFECQKRNSCVL